jgi:hypothetical protein
MGATFVTDKITAKTPALAKAAGHALIERSRERHVAESYTGSFAECNGVVVEAKSFKDTEAADTYLYENAQKWGPMVIVKVGRSYYAGAWCSS